MRGLSLSLCLCLGSLLRLCSECNVQMPRVISPSVVFHAVCMHDVVCYNPAIWNNLLIGGQKIPSDRCVIKTLIHINIFRMRFYFENPTAQRLSQFPPSETILQASSHGRRGDNIYSPRGNKSATWNVLIMLHR